MTNWESQHPVDDAQETTVHRGGAPLVVFACILVVAVTAASSALLAEEDDDGAEPVALAAEAGGVVLEPVGSDDEHAFFTGLDLAGADDAERTLTEITDQVATLPPFAEGQDETTATLAGRQAVGTEPGLYGGHRREAVCDIDSLVSSLTEPEASGEDEADETDDADGTDDAADAEGEADGTEGDSDAEGAGSADRGSVWAEMQGLDSPDQIADFVGGLTAVRLRLDTRVTGHGYRDGEPAPYQSLLQAGTAVLVDDTGMPRVRCSSGNPLTAPSPLEDLDESRALAPEGLTVNPDQAWDRLDPEQAVAVTAGPEPVEDLLVVGIDTTDLMERPVGTNGGRDLAPGDVIVILRWDSPADLDLAVTDPNEARIGPESPDPENSRGRLEEDANELCEGNMTGQERIWWPDGDAPPGDYTVIVRGHAVGESYEPDCGGESAEYTVTVQLFGRDDIVETGTVEDQESRDFDFTLEE